MSDVIEIPLMFFTNSEDFQYDNKSDRFEDANAKAIERLKLYEKIIPELQKDELFIKFTAGQRAGTIARIENYSFDEFFRFAVWMKTSKCGPQHRSTVVDDPYSWMPGGRGSLSTTVRTAGRVFVENVPCWKSEVFSSWLTSCKSLQPIVDGKKRLAPFTLDSAFMDSARPVILIGYNGPTVWEYAKKVHANPKVSMTDRFGAKVEEGDLIILASKPSGKQLVGKIQRISPKYSIWIKHIGAELPHMEVSTRPDQIIRVKDIEQTLMMLKLSTL